MPAPQERKALTPQQRERKARERLAAAIENYATWRGRAEWTNGYRCGGRDTADTYRREMDQHVEVTAAKDEAARALAAYARAIRRTVKETTT